MATLHGFDPDDWLGDGFTVECRLRAAPSDDALRRLGRGAARFRAGELGLRFTGPFVIVELLPHPGRERDALSALAELVLEATRDELVEAVVLNAIENRAAPRPTSPGPALPGSTRPVDPALPAPARSPVFDAALREVTGAARRKALDAFLAAAREQPVRLRELPAPSVVPVPVPAALRALELRPDEQRDDLFRPDSTAPRVDGVSWPDGFVLDGDVAVRGERALLAARTEPRRLLRDHGPTEVLLLDGGAVRPAYRLPDRDQGLESLSWLDDAHAVIASRKRTVVVSLADGAERAAASGGGEVRAAAGVIAVASRGKARLLAWRDDELAVLARWEHPELALGPVVDGRPTFRIGDRHWIPEAIPAQPAPKRAKATRARGKKKPALAPMPFAELAPAPARTWLTQAQWDAFAAAGLGIRPHMAHFEEPNGFRSGDVALGVCTRGVAVLREPGPPRLIRWEGDQLLSRLRFVDGHVFAADGNVLVEAALDDEALREAFRPAKAAGFMRVLEPLSRDELVALTSAGLLVVERAGGRLRQRGFLKVSKPTQLVVSASRREAMIGSEAKQRLVLASLDTVKAIATFTEDAEEIRAVPGGWQVADPRRQRAWRLA